MVDPTFITMQIKRSNKFSRFMSSEHEFSRNLCRTRSYTRPKRYFHQTTTTRLFRFILEWEKCLQEASLTKFPKALRNLFASILIESKITDASELFKNFEVDLMEDWTNEWHRKNRGVKLEKTDNGTTFHEQFIFQNIEHTSKEETDSFTRYLTCSSLKTKL